MKVETHRQLADFIWSICDLLRGPYKRNEYRKVILPFTVLRRFDGILAETQAQVRAERPKVEGKSEAVKLALLRKVTQVEFYNLSDFSFDNLLDDPDGLAANLNEYLLGFSPSVREVFEHFGIEAQILRLDEKDLLYEVVKAFGKVDLSPQRISNLQMGYVFEELIRIGAEQSNETAGEHFTPREVIKLMVDLLLCEEELGKGHVVRKIYDPACGTGGMLSEAEAYLHALNADARPMLYGQDWNDEAWAICRADMLIKGLEAENIKRGDTFTHDQYQGQTFDYMLANPPFGVSWKQMEKAIQREAAESGFAGRFGAGLPRINDGSLLFLQHMLSKMQPSTGEGSRLAVVFSGSPLFTGDAGSGESDIRRWIIESDWLEAVVALPDQLFYNTGISTYIWVLTNRKSPRRRGKIQLIDARNYSVPMRKSLGNKRKQVGDGHEGRPDQIAEVVRHYQAFADGATDAEGRVVCRIFANQDFGYHKIIVERPLRLNFALNEDRRAQVKKEKAFNNLATSKKALDSPAYQEEIARGQRQQAQLLTLLADMDKAYPGEVWHNRDAFEKVLTDYLRHRKAERMPTPLIKALLKALGERDPEADICYKAGSPEADPELRDSELVPLHEDIEAYFEREVKPHVPDAWIDHSKTKVGYEIPLNRHFYVYEPPRPLPVIEAELKDLERDIVQLLSEVTGGEDTL